jgi:hypothetical protein
MTGFSIKLEVAGENRKSRWRSIWAPKARASKGVRGMLPWEIFENREAVWGISWILGTLIKH